MKYGEIRSAPRVGITIPWMNKPSASSCSAHAPFEARAAYKAALGSIA
jgi:hypothetical protein